MEGICIKTVHQNLWSLFAFALIFSPHLGNPNITTGGCVEEILKKWAHGIQQQWRFCMKCLVGRPSSHGPSVSILKPSSISGEKGLNFDFLVLNITKHSSYLIYNTALYFSPVIQKQYHEKYGYDEMIPVAANDVAFSTHAVLLTAFTLSQVLIYDRGTQKVSKTCIGISSVVWATALVCLIISWPKHSWLWLISVFNNIQVVMTAIKYIPQVVMNFRRKSTIGWSIGNIILDLTGAILNFAQMGVQSIDQGTWVNFYGNIGKTLLSLEVVFFDLVFIFQHYVLYRGKKEETGRTIIEERIAPLMKPASTSQTDTAKETTLDV